MVAAAAAARRRGGLDLASFTIPNFLSPGAGRRVRAFRAGGAFIAGPASACIFWPGLSVLWWASRCSRCGYIGGGDAKLFAAVALWLGLQDLLPYTLVASRSGRLLTLALLALRQLPLPAGLARQRLDPQAARQKFRHSLWRGAGGGRLSLLPHAEILPSLPAADAALRTLQAALAQFISASLSNF